MSWTCSNCETLNDPASLVCEVCGHEPPSIPSWKCVNCETLNSGVQGQCEVCGMEKAHSKAEATRIELEERNKPQALFQKDSGQKLVNSLPEIKEIKEKEAKKADRTLRGGFFGLTLFIGIFMLANSQLFGLPFVVIGFIGLLYVFRQSPVMASSPGKIHKLPEHMERTMEMPFEGEVKGIYWNGTDREIVLVNETGLVQVRERFEKSIKLQVDSRIGNVVKTKLTDSFIAIYSPGSITLFPYPHYPIKKAPQIRLDHPVTFCDIQYHASSDLIMSIDNLGDFRVMRYEVGKSFEAIRKIHLGEELIGFYPHPDGKRVAFFFQVGRFECWEFWTLKRLNSGSMAIQGLRKVDSWRNAALIIQDIDGHNFYMSVKGLFEGKLGDISEIRNSIGEPFALPDGFLVIKTHDRKFDLYKIYPRPTLLASPIIGFDIGSFFCLIGSENKLVVGGMNGEIKFVDFA